MSTFRHFCFRSHRLNLSNEEILYLELAFACTRFLSNHFTTLLQKTPARKLHSEDFNYDAVKSVIDEVSRTSSAIPFRTVHPAFLDAEAYAISERWVRYLTKDDPAPMFRKFKDPQCVWVLDPDAVSVQKESFFLPGSALLIRLQEPKIKLFGKPVCYQIRRQENGYYYLAVLYERPMMTPFQCSDTLIPQLGIKLQNAITGIDPFAINTLAVQEPVIDQGLIYQLRKKVLTRYLTPKPIDVRAPLETIAA